MGNWSNARLIVAGPRGDVLRFSRQARARPSSLFGWDMLQGEGADLRSERIEALGPALAKKLYLFQIRNDDGRDHFCQVSRQFPALRFVLVYFDPGDDRNGSYFISRERARNYELPVELQQAVMARHGLTDEVFGGDWSQDDECNYWEATWELMELAEAHWQQSLLRAIRHIRCRKPFHND